MRPCVGQKIHAIRSGTAEAGQDFADNFSRRAELFRFAAAGPEGDSEAVDQKLLVGAAFYPSGEKAEDGVTELVDDVVPVKHRRYFSSVRSSPKI